MSFLCSSCFVFCCGNVTGLQTRATCARSAGRTRCRRRCGMRKGRKMEVRRSPNLTQLQQHLHQRLSRRRISIFMIESLAPVFVVSPLDMVDYFFLSKIKCRKYSFNRVSGMALLFLPILFPRVAGICCRFDTRTWFRCWLGHMSEPSPLHYEPVDRSAYVFVLVITWRTLLDISFSIYPYTHKHRFFALLCLQLFFL